MKIERQKWFGCACCPPNVARLLSSIGGYAYEQNEDSLYMNLFIGGDMNLTLGGKQVGIKVETNYPWKGSVKATITEADAAKFAFKVRIPDWCTEYALTINGEKADVAIEKGYAVFDRVWAAGDVIELVMEMPVVLVEANPNVREDVGKVAVTRGPVVFCLEEEDNGPVLQDLYLKEDASFNVNYEENLLKGIVTIEADGKRVSDQGWNGKTLYRPYKGKATVDKKLKFIPYYSWSNRKVGEILVWVKI